MKKRMLAMLLAGAMIVPALAGCKSSDSGETTAEAGSTTEAEVKEDDLTQSQEISIWLYKDDYTYYDSYSDNPIVTYLNDKFNATLSFQQPAMGSELEQFSLMLGTGSYTDVMEVSYSTESVSTLYEDGVIIDLAPYLENYAPDFYAWLQADENEDVSKALYDDEGHLFTIPMNVATEETLLWGGLVYREDILETMTGGYVSFPSGEDSPTTVADWEYMLELFTQYFQAAGFTDYAGLILPYMGFFETGELLNGFDAAPSFYVDDDGTVKFGPTEIEFYNYLVKMNEWYEKGYIYQDFASRTNDVFYLPNTALTYGGAAGIWYGLNSQLGDVMSMPEYGLTMNVLPTAAPLDTDNDASGLGYLGIDTARASMNTNGYVVSSSCTEEKLIRWLTICNYLFTEEGGMLKTYGLTTEQGADENSIYQAAGITGGAYTFDGTTFTYNEKLQPSVGEISLAGDNMSFIGTRLPGLNINTYELANSTEQTVEASGIWRTFGKDNNYPSSITLSGEDSDTNSDNYTNYHDYLVSMVPKFIMGTEELNEDTWNAFVEQMNNLGVTESKELYQTYYDAYESK